MKTHPDMQKDMTNAMDKALKSVSKERLSEASWFSREEEKMYTLPAEVQTADEFKEWLDKAAAEL